MGASVVHGSPVLAQPGLPEILRTFSALGERL
jgi:hypothetical protein